MTIMVTQHLRQLPTSSSSCMLATTTKSHDTRASMDLVTAFLLELEQEQHHHQAHSSSSGTRARLVVHPASRKLMVVPQSTKGQQHPRPAGMQRILGAILPPSPQSSSDDDDFDSSTVPVLPTNTNIHKWAKEYKCQEQERRDSVDDHSGGPAAAKTKNVETRDRAAR